jgi:predicted nucleic acid-binding protein
MAPWLANSELFLEGLRHSFGPRVVPVDSDIAPLWGQLRAATRTPAIDTLFAATAIVHGWTLVTRNVRDVEQTGCAVLNPYT